MTASVVLAIATSNINKVKEAEIVLRDYGISLEPVPVRKVEIQHDSLYEIARYAALHAFLALRRPVVVEDSGLYVEALNGFPGPYSNYVFKTIGIRGVLKLLSDLQDPRERRARFLAVVALALSEREVVIFDGVAEGYISTEARGSGGFGFDPIFVPLGESRTFAEMGPEEKCRLSHRGQAFRRLAEWVSANRAYFAAKMQHHSHI